MKEKKEYMEKIYEQFSQDGTPSKETEKLYDKFSEKIDELKGKLKGEELKEIKELEDLVWDIILAEGKHSFMKGFSVAVNIREENIN